MRPIHFSFVSSAQRRKLIVTALSATLAIAGLLLASDASPSAHKEVAAPDAPTFTWRFRATDSTGGEIEDTLEAKSEEDAIAAIRQKGYYVIEIRRKPTNANWPRQDPEPPVTWEYVNFFEQLAALVDVHVPARTALSAISSSMESRRYADGANRLAERMDGGIKLPEALRLDLDLFRTETICICAAGEATGELGTYLKQHADHLRGLYTLRQGNVESRCLVVGVCLTVLFGFLIVALAASRVEKNFIGETKPDCRGTSGGIEECLGNKNSSSAACFMRRWMRRCRLAVTQKPQVAAVVIVGVAVTVALHMSLFRGPLADLQVHSSIHEGTSILGHNISLGVPVLEAIRASFGDRGNIRLQQVERQVADGIRDGKPFASAIDKFAILTDVEIRLLDAGEETGRFDDQLTMVARLRLAAWSRTREQITRRSASVAALAVLLVLTGFGVCQHACRRSRS